MTQKIRPRHPEKVKNPINPIKKNQIGLDLNSIIVRNFF